MVTKLRTMVGLGYFRRAVRQRLERAERYDNWAAVDAYAEVLRLADEHLSEE